MPDETVNIHVTGDAPAVGPLREVNDQLAQLTGKQKETAAATQTHTAAAKENNETMQSAKKGIGDVVQGLTGLSPELLTAGGAIVALYEGMKQSIDADVELGTETRKLSLLIGASATESSKLIAVSDDLGVSYETLTRGMEAAIRKGYAPTIEGLAKMGEKYRSIQDPIERSKYLMDTFGRAGAELAPILEASTAKLDELAKGAEQAGIIMDSEGVRRVRAYKLAVNDLNDAFTGLKIRVGDAVLPALTDAINWTSTAILNTESWTKSLGENMRIMDIQYQAAQHHITQEQAHTLILQLQNEQIIQNTQSTEAFRKADDAASAAVDTNTAALESNKQAAKDLAFDLSALTNKSLFDLAAKATENKDDQLKLAEAMGLVSEKSVYAQDKIAAWTQSVKDGKMTWSEFIAQVTALSEGLNNIPTNKHVTLTLDTIENHYVNDRKVGGAVSDIAQNYTSTADIMAHTAAQQAANQITANLSRGNVAPRAIGGPGYGRTLVGENGPEVVDLPLGSQVINNYNTNYNLTAHYPGYQDPHAARNDLIAMTLLKNQGAAKWGGD